MSALIIDGVDICATYGVVISGSGTFSSPARDYTAESVHGRNGDILIDNNRYSNIDVTYPCYISSDFKTRFDALKAFLLSRSGYVRIEDSYNPESYRMGYFAAEIVPEMTVQNRAGSFDLVFVCKPQRFLKSGETAVDISEIGHSQMHRDSNFREYERLTVAQAKANYNANNHDNNRIIKLFFGDAGFADSDIIMCCIVNVRKGQTYRWTRQDGKANNRIVIAGIIEYAGHVGHKHEQANTAAESFNFTPNTSQIMVYTAQASTQTITMDSKVMYQTGDMLNAQINNPYSFDALPMINITFKNTTPGTGRLVTINGSTIKNISLPAISSIDYMTVTVDAETGQMYYISDGSMHNASQYMSAGDISLVPGENEVIIADTVDVEVIPRWWTV